MRLLRFARNDGILEFHRDPPVKLGDDIVGNSRIPSKILEFLKIPPNPKKPKSAIKTSS